MSEDRQQKRQPLRRFPSKPPGLGDQGAVAIYVTLIVALLIGFVGLAIDFSRYYISDTQAQDAADAAALAAASQLDRNTDAITRATLAAQTSPLASNRQALSDTPGTVTIETLRFLSSLPDDDEPITATHVTTDPTNAYFVEVTTATLSQSPTFLRAIGITEPAYTRGVAVAGNNQVLCRIPPLMMCNPFEASAGIGAPFDVSEGRGMQIRAKAKNPGSSLPWAPGEFGFLQTPTGPGAKELADAIANYAPDGCYGTSVDIKTGNIESVAGAFNVRFDIYEGPHIGAGSKTNPDYRPARNVVKGTIPSPTACSPGLVPEVAGESRALGMPRDDCLGTASCPPNNSDVFGDGEWDRANYWVINHGGTPGTQWSVLKPPELALNASRYEVYRWEIDHAIPTLGTPDDHIEEGAPLCSTAASPGLSEPDRRILYVAVVNCLEHGPLNGAESGVPVEQYLKVFFTEPVLTMSSGLIKNADPAVDISSLTLSTVWIEVVDAVDPGLDEVLHDVIQLYR